MNGLDVRKVYYNPDGSADWLKSIVKTVFVYGRYTEMVVCSVAANRALRLYYKRTDLGGSYE